MKSRLLKRMREGLLKTIRVSFFSGRFLVACLPLARKEFDRFLRARTFEGQKLEIALI